MKSVIYLAAGCFWGVQEKLRQLPGVLETEVGYCGGHTEKTSYEEVCRGNTGHAEVCKVTYDEAYLGPLLKSFFSIHDPTQLNRQGTDVGDQYRSAIFVTENSQKKMALDLIEEMSTGQKIVTKVEECKNYVRAEDYHQDYVQRKGWSCAF